METTPTSPTHRKRIALQSVGAVVLPFVVVSLYLVFTRWPSHRFTTFSDYAGIGASVSVGAALVGALPISGATRVALLILYIPLLLFLLFVYSLQFVGIVFGDWI